MKQRIITIIVVLALVFICSNNSTVTTHLVCNDNGRVYHCEYPLHHVPSQSTLDFIFQDTGVDR